MRHATAERPHLLARLGQADPYRLALLIPVVFVLHFLEEWPGFLDWLNSLLREPLGIVPYYAINLAAFVGSLLVAASVASGRSLPSLYFAIGWVAFLILGNGLLHVGATVALGRYSPGAVTSLVIYLPFAAWFFRQALLRSEARPLPLAGAAAAGLALMGTQGYLVLVEGRMPV